MNTDRPAQAQPGNFDEVVRLITTHQTRLRGFIRCLLFDPQHAEDVLQETNMVLWQKADQYQVGSDFWAWASQIARFKVLSHAKKLKRDQVLRDDSFLAALTAAAERRSVDIDERKIALEQCLSRLPPAQRRLVEMRYGMERSVGEIATSVGRPEGSIRQTLYRIRGILLTCIEQKKAPVVGVQGS